MKKDADQKDCARVLFALCRDFTAAVQQRSTEGSWKTIQLVSENRFDVGDLRWHVKRIHDCERLLEDSKNETLAAKGYAKKIVRTGRGSSASGAILYRKDVLAILRKQIMMGLSQSVIFTSQDVPRHVGHLVTALRGQRAEKEPEKRMELARRNVWWNSDSEDSPRSFDCLRQIYWDQTATSLKFHALVFYPVRVGLFSFMNRKKKDMTDCMLTLSGLLPVRAAELREENGEQDVDESRYMHWFAL